MKVIFLDIDGVFNYHKCKYIKHGLYFLDPNKIQLFKQIIDATGAKIVLSSTWRKDNELLAELKAEFSKFGLEIFSQTPILGYRGAEIKRWTNNWDGEPIENFIIIDDDTDVKPCGNRLIQTSFYKISREHS